MSQKPNQSANYANSHKYNPDADYLIIGNAFTSSITPAWDKRMFGMAFIASEEDIYGSGESYLKFLKFVEAFLRSFQANPILKVSSEQSIHLLISRIDYDGNKRKGTDDLIHLNIKMGKMGDKQYVYDVANMIQFVIENQGEDISFVNTEIDGDHISNDTS